MADYTYVGNSVVKGSVGSVFYKSSANVLKWGAWKFGTIKWGDSTPMNIKDGATFTDSGSKETVPAAIVATKEAKPGSPTFSSEARPIT